MTCISPPELNDRQLLAFVDGEAGQEIVAHVEACPHCRQKARRLARLQNRLTAQLLRVTCPSPERLGEYHLGLLSRARSDAIAQHLAVCVRCADEVAQLAGYLEALTPSLELSRLEQVQDRVSVLIGRLTVAGEPYGGLTPALAGIRGTDEAPLLYQADGVQLIVDVQEDADQPERRAIFGLVAGVDDAAGLEAHLWRQDRPITTAPVDELGNFVISGLERGHYDLIISGPAVELHVRALEI